VIRRAFQPAYIHWDGEAVTRTTGQVYLSLRNSLTGCIGQRDLHDANLQDIVGMDFNGSSPLSEVLQISHSVRRDAEGNLEVTLGRFNPREDVRKAAGYTKRAFRYRIRLMAVAFDFRQEYLEYLDIKDLDLHGSEIMEAQTICLKAQADPSCIVMLSMSLLMYAHTGHNGEYVLLNNKGFSPCAIIAAYQSPEPAPNTADPIRLSKEAYPDRYMKIEEMGYDGNRLLRELQKHLTKAGKGKKTDLPASPLEPDVKLGQKVYFRKG
jgi:hypothetical protein